MHILNILCRISSSSIELCSKGLYPEDLPSSKVIRNELAKGTPVAIKGSVVALSYKLEIIVEVITEPVTLIPTELCGPKIIEARF